MLPQHHRAVGDYLQERPYCPESPLANGCGQKFIARLLNRILLEKASNEGGIEIRSNLNDRAIHKATYPTVPVVEPHAILRRS
jgi:hypothetical protein